MDPFSISPLMSSSSSTSLPNGSNNSAATKSVTPLVVALTGGPCGGKSSCLTILSDALENVGCKVYRVPETATILLNGGVVFSELTSEQIYDFQKSILQTMMSIETTFRRLAASNARRGIPTVILCDRGAMDPSAYMERDSWLKLLSELELTESGLRDDRYDLVVHLVTAALGAEPFYTTENNNVRSEGIEMARDLDKKVMQAWMGHSYFHIVGNETDFVGKCNRVVQVVLKRLGQRDKRHGNNITKHKYLLKSPPPTVFPVPIREFKVEHIFLSNSNHQSQIRIRKREALDPTTGAVTSMQYSMTLRLPEVDGQRVEKRRNLSGREYEDLRSQADSTRTPIHKHRQTFIWNNIYYQLDTFLNGPQKDLMLLEAYFDDDLREEGSHYDVVRVPDWLDGEEVTGVVEYGLWELAAVKE